MHTEQVHIKKKARTESKSISKDEISGRYYNGKRPSKDHTKGRRGAKGSSSESSDSLPYVNGYKHELTLLHIYSKVHSSVEGNVLKEMILLLQEHPKFEEKDWDKNTDHDLFLGYILDQFNRLFCQKHPVFLKFPEDDIPEFYWISALDECESYGNIIPFVWINLLKDKDKEFLRITQHFLSISYHHLNIPAWNDYNQSCYIDELSARIDDDDDDLAEEYDIEDLESLKSDFADWDEGIKFYHSAIKNSHSLVKFKRMAGNYQPRNKYFKKVVDWYVKAIPMIKRGINFHQFENSPLTDDGNPYAADRYYNNGEAWPSMYCGFTWSFEGYIGKTLSSDLDETAGNCGVIPFIESVKITSEKVEPPIFRTAKQFYDWMSEGNKACRDLFDHLLNSKSKCLPKH